ncbi:DUF5313 family protein [Rhodococcus oxybenzonivorans]|jgi:hypothetical protein|uniref:DUF5313 domain-containing protein n=1 Tax=Rhodococcus oxybenzonivorans TaxID=1990687 RepID=A0A2S2C151_9NOCA|nr:MULTISPECIES: DUF5313 family protein [Rhodococcus]AWK74478.1 hypothetical protein CBI38_25925 [Rhodococcus oxybenzonivorans]MDV7355187.1 DUF5313 family protein [Rhodococcus oxybenzonivorans]
MSRQTERTRPSPIQWLGYALGRKLPHSMQDWVRNDLTGDRAVPRHLVRSMVPFIPVFAAFLLFPGPLWLRGSMILLGLLLALFYAVSYMAQNRARRLERHGLPPDLENPKKASQHEAEKAAYERLHGPAHLGHVELRRSGNELA